MVASSVTALTAKDSCPRRLVLRILIAAFGTGVAAALYALLEGRARAAGLQTLKTEASELARPFFLRHGWTLIERQNLVREGVSLHNYRMEKQLTPIKTA